MDLNIIGYSSKLTSSINSRVISLLNLRKSEEESLVDLYDKLTRSDIDSDTANRISDQIKKSEEKLIELGIRIDELTGVLKHIHLNLADF